MARKAKDYSHLYQRARLKVKLSKNTKKEIRQKEINRLYKVRSDYKKLEAQKGLYKREKKQIHKALIIIEKSIRKCRNVKQKKTIRITKRNEQRITKKSDILRVKIWLADEELRKRLKKAYETRKKKTGIKKVIILDQVLNPVKEINKIWVYFNRLKDEAELNNLEDNSLVFIAFETVYAENTLYVYIPYVDEDE